MHTADHPSGPPGSGLPKAGQLLDLSVRDLGSEGQGVARAGGVAVFVPGAVPGDTIRARVVRARKAFVEAELVEVLEPAPGRVSPACPAASACGGCDLLALSYEAQLAWKTKTVREALRRVGHLGDVPVADCLGAASPFGYRNKAQFPVVAVYRDGRTGSARPGQGRSGAGPGGHPGRGSRSVRRPAAARAQAGLRAGLFRRGTHEVIPVESCLLQHPVNNAVLAAAARLASELRIPAFDEDTGEGLLRHILARVSSDGREAMAVLVTSQVTFPMGRRLAAALQKSVPQVKTVVQNVNTRHTNVILGPRDIVLSGPGHIVDHLGGLRFRVSASSFFQVNPAQAEVLYGVAARMVEGEAASAASGPPVPPARRVADVYCGVGTITLFLAKRLATLEEIVGIESNPAAVRDAAANARANHIEEAVFVCGDAAAVLRDMARAGVGLDTVVLDPPRKGCEPAVLEALARMAVRRLVYVSCNPATLARDLAVLTGGPRPFKLGKVQPVDMFPQTVHIETVVDLLR